MDREKRIEEMDMVSKKLVTTIVILIFIPFFVSIGGLFLTVEIINRKFDASAHLKDENIKVIVRNTLELFREDLKNGGFSSSAAGTPAGTPAENEKREIKLEGASLSTFEDHFYIDNVPFFKGDIIAPYGVAVFIGRDSVIFRGFDDTITVLGKELPSSKSKDSDKSEEENKEQVAKK